MLVKEFYKKKQKILPQNTFKHRAPLGLNQPFVNPKLDASCMHLLSSPKYISIQLISTTKPLFCY